MISIAIYSPHAEPQQTGRLSYVLDWLLKERLKLGYTITNNKEEAMSAPCRIAYGAHIPGSVSIPDSGLLKERFSTGHTTGNGLNVCTPKTGEWNGRPVLFATQGDDFTLPFDLFSAIFYLLSRYEEYFPFTPDKHGRFPATESILFKSGWLARPIVDEWVAAFREQITTTLGIPVPEPLFSFQPTYDIDMAYSHAYKGIGRIIGAYIRAMLKGDVVQISERTQVLKKKATDPYDSFTWLRNLHERLAYKPVYFILCALRTTPFDRNIHPRHPAMTRVIRQLDKEGKTGIHPSYFATHYDVVAKEKKALEQITGRSISASRQHYIKLKIPDTYYLLMDNAITEDHSMGYGTHLGFRAGTGSSFLWYDLHKEVTTGIRIHPFCFMDTTAHFEQGLSAPQAFEQLTEMAHLLKSTGSTLITVFHNFSLGTARDWSGWSTAYQSFLSEMCEPERV